jgi:hypothetical protein
MKRFLFLGITFVFIIMLLFPPWLTIENRPRTNIKYSLLLGYAFIGQPPKDASGIDWGRLGLQIGCLAVISAAILLYGKFFPKSSLIPLKPFIVILSILASLLFGWVIARAILWYGIEKPRITKQSAGGIDVVLMDEIAKENKPPPPVSSPQKPIRQSRINTAFLDELEKSEPNQRQFE